MCGAVCCAWLEQIVLLWPFDNWCVTLCTSCPALANKGSTWPRFSWVPQSAQQLQLCLMALCTCMDVLSWACCYTFTTLLATCCLFSALNCQPDGGCQTSGRVPRVDAGARPYNCAAVSTLQTSVSMLIALLTFESDCTYWGEAHLPCEPQTVQVTSRPVGQQRVSTAADLSYTGWPTLATRPMWSWS